MLSNEEIKNLLISEIVTCNPYTGTNIFNLNSDQQSEIYKRYTSSKDYEYVFEPINDENVRTRAIDLFVHLDNDE